MTVKDAGPIVDRKKVSRQKLLAAARKLFIEEGYHNTRPQDIARTADVGHGTFYLHFADKRECFLAFVAQAAQEVDEAVAPLASKAKTLEEFICFILDGVQSYVEKHPGVLAAAMIDPGMIDRKEDGKGNTLIDLWANNWAATLAEMAKRGEIAKDLEPKLLGYAIVGLLHHASVGAAQNNVERRKLIDTVVPFIVRGLTPVGK